MIFYFTGTGNSRWAAEQLAEATGDTLKFIPDERRKAALQPEGGQAGGPLTYQLAEGDRLGFCFPTHGWQPPRIVREFIRRATFITAPQSEKCTPSSITNRQSPYVYALTTCGDNMGYAMRILNKELGRKGLKADATFAVVMPESNVCFSFLHLDTPENEARKIAAARKRMVDICEKVKRCQRGVEELVKGAIPYTYTYVIGGYYNKHLITDSHFWVDEAACIRCGLCAKLCPVGDITCTLPAPRQDSESEKPVAQSEKKLPPRWKHDGSCTNCLACCHHCPQHAIHWGKMKRGQYLFKNKRIKE